MKDRTAYNMEYNRENTKQISLRLNLKHDADVLERLAEVDNMQGYIKGLIRRDMEKDKLNTICVKLDSELMDYLCACVDEHCKRHGLTTPADYMRKCLEMDRMIEERLAMSDSCTLYRMPDDFGEIEDV